MKKSRRKFKPNRLTVNSSEANELFLAKIIDKYPGIGSHIHRVSLGFIRKQGKHYYSLEITLKDQDEIGIADFDNHLCSDQFLKPPMAYMDNYLTIFDEHFESVASELMLIIGRNNIRRIINGWKRGLASHLDEQAAKSITHTPT